MHLQMFRARTKGIKTFRVAPTSRGWKITLHHAQTRRGTGTMLYAIFGVSRWSSASSKGQKDKQNQARIRDIRSTKPRYPSSRGRRVTVSIV